MGAGVALGKAWLGTGANRTFTPPPRLHHPPCMAAGYTQILEFSISYCGALRLQRLAGNGTVHYVLSTPGAQHLQAIAAARERQREPEARQTETCRDHSSTNPARQVLYAQSLTAGTLVFAAPLFDNGICRSSVIPGASPVSPSCKYQINDQQRRRFG